MNGCPTGLRTSADILRCAAPPEQGRSASERNGSDPVIFDFSIVYRPFLRQKTAICAVVCSMDGPVCHALLPALPYREPIAMTLKKLRRTIAMNVGKSRGNELNRRSFLVGSTMLAGTISTFSQVPAALAEDEAQGQVMVRVASLLAGKDVDPILVARAESALKISDEGFSEGFAVLAHFISANGITDSRSLDAAPGFDGELRETAKTLLKALYLGYTGEPQAHVANDGVQFVTFTQALGFQVTSPFVPIPSYSRWRSGYWAALPDET